MLSDPVTLKVDSIAVSLPRISSGTGTATYRDTEYLKTSDSESSMELIISHNEGRRARRVVRINVTKKTVGPVAMPPAVMSAYLVIDTPTSGFSSVEVGNIAAGVLDLLGDVSGSDVVAGGTLVRVVNGES